MNSFSLWLINTLIRLYVRVTCRVDAPNFDRIPLQGPLIAIANHTGQIEVPILAAWLYPRRISGWAKAETFDNKFLKWVFDTWGIIPVRRGEADMHALKEALRAIEQGVIFGIAPEGTRNYNGILRRAMPGTVIIAIHSGAPIIPIAHWGGEVFMKNLKQFKRTDFHIRVGEPFKVEIPKGTKLTAEVRQQAVDEMMYRLARLLPEAYRGEYSDLDKATEQYIKPLS